MVALPRLSSRRHALVARFRRAAARQEDGLVLIDGVHLVDEALGARLSVEVMLATDPEHPVVARARAAGAEVYHATIGVLAAASPVRTPTGVVALARWAPVSLEASLTGRHDVALGLVDVQDPGNVGSAIRAADALGATAVLALEQSADPAGWRALRGAMGSTFHLPVARSSLREALAVARNRGVRIVAAVAAGGTAPHGVDLTPPLLLLTGGEGAGLGSDAISAAAVCVTIPMAPRVDSLNVAAAAAILLYEARRQREGRP